MNILKYASLLIFAFTTIVGNAQNDIKGRKQAEYHYTQAQKAYSYHKIQETYNELNFAIQNDSTFIPAYQVLAQLMVGEKKYDEMFEIFELAATFSTNEFPDFYFEYAGAAQFFKKTEVAYKYFKKYLTIDGIDPNVKKRAEEGLAQCEFIIEAKKNPVPFEPVNLGPNVNSVHDEYLPSITVDGKTLVLTVKLPHHIKDYNQENLNEDFFVSYLENGEWSKAKNMGSQVNTPDNEGAQCISPDGKYLFYTSCSLNKGMGGCDIYMCRWTEQGWSTPENLGYPINSKHWEGHPSFAPDGKTLYFVSDRPGGIGAQDIYSSDLLEDGSWDRPANLGPNINTTRYDVSPFIHTDNATLYFSSNGLQGMGAADLFLSRKDKDGKWQKPENLGYPINTEDNETSIIVNADGSKAYFSAEREGGVGKLDIYFFNLHEKARPTNTTYVKGILGNGFSDSDKLPEVELFDLETKELITKASVNKDGSFLVCLPTGKDYAFNISMEGYLFYSENFSLKDNVNDKPFELKVNLKPIKEGERVVLNNVFFKTNSYDLDPRSIVELDKVVRFLEDNSRVKIQIEGHTDNEGADDYNLKLSNDRAKSVQDYLSKTISVKRLSFIGYGENRPIATNETLEGRSQNRRTEFVIVK